MGDPEYGTQYQEDGGWVDRYFFVFSVSLPNLDEKEADPTRFWVSLFWCPYRDSNPGFSLERAAS